MSEKELKLHEDAEIGDESAFDPEDLIGQTLAGRYEIEQRIGKGGMGVVYLASQSALNRKVVVKVLARELGEDSEAITRFEREALGLSQLTHPNIVTIYDFGRDKELAYIVMEYVDGMTLSQHVRRAQVLGFDEFAHISTQIMDALAEAHARGIIHRDIKPSNIMLCERHGHANFVKVLDFGLAKLIHDSVEVTKKQNLVGSVAFLAPEQILGLEFDQRVDVYALGVLFYYMLSGQKPFRGEDDLSILYQHIHKDPTPLAEVLPAHHQVPEEIIRIIHQCLSKDPRQRPENARELLNLFQLDMSRSVFKVPWTTGEWTTPSGLQQAVARQTGQHPSIPGQLQTPHSGLIPLSPTTDHSGQYNQASMTGLSHPSMQSGVYPYGPPQQSNRGLIIGGLLLIAALVVGGFVLINSQKSDPQPVVTQLSEQQLVAMLDEVDGVIKESRWGQAETMLNSMEPKLATHPPLLKRAAAMSERISTGQLMAKALNAQKQGDTEAARQLYTQILNRDPSHEQALAALEALPQEREGTEQPADAAMGRLKIDSRIKARVEINDKFIGYTPVSQDFAPGEYSVAVTAHGYKDWTKEVTLKQEGSIVLDANLIPEGSSKSSRKTTRTNTGSSKIDAGAKPETMPKVEEPKVEEPKPEKKPGLIFTPGKKDTSKGALLPVNN